MITKACRQILSGLAVLLAFAAFPTQAKSGDVIVCNRSQTTYFIASFWKTGPLSCAISGTNCSISSSGWWTARPGQCIRPTTAIYAETYLAIVERDADNRMYPASAPVNERILNTPRRRGSTGLGGRFNACVKRGNFNRTVRGNWASVFNQTCPADYISLPLSMLVRGSGDGNETVNLR